MDDTLASDINAADVLDMAEGETIEAPDTAVSADQYVESDQSVLTKCVTRSRDQIEIVEWTSPARGTDIESTIITTEQKFLDFFGEPPPAQIQFPDEWVYVWVQGPWYGLTVESISFQLCPDYSAFDATLAMPGDDCDVIGGDMDYLSAALLVTFEAVPGASTESPGGGGGVDLKSCAQDGAQAREECNMTTLCQPGLVCAGMTQGGQGVCVPSTNLASFTNSVATPIPDDDIAGVQITNPVAGLDGTVLDVIVSAEIDHPKPEDLQITLESPDGTQSVVWDQDLGSAPLHLARTAAGFVGAEPVGDWKLHIVDLQAGNVGEVDRWTLLLTTTGL